MMSAQNSSPTGARRRAEQRELMGYVWGLGLALVLTLVPFALVYWGGGGGARIALLVVIAVLAVVQVVVQLRFFLHLGLRRKREDLQLILFSAALLAIMVGGTLWIMANLAGRMALPG